MTTSMYAEAVSRLDNAASYTEISSEVLEKLRYPKFCFDAAEKNRYAACSLYSSIK